MRRVRVSLGIVVVSFALLALGLPNAPTAQAAASQVVSGRALDSDDHPIVGLKVQLFESGANPAEEPPVSSSQTNASGVFAIDAPTPQEINSYNLVLGWGDDQYAPVTNDIAVLPGTDQPAGDIHLHLVYATGRVLDYKGRPVQGVKVSSQVWSGGEWVWFNGDETTLTDDGGNYRVQLKPLAEFTVKFDITDVRWAYLGGSSDAPSPGDPTTTREGSDTDVAGVDVVLPEYHKLKTSLVTPYGEPIGAAFVALYALNHQPGEGILFSLDEGASGSYEADVPPGNYDLVVDATTASPAVQSYSRAVSVLHADVDLSGVSLQLADPSISGAVYDRYGSPLAGVSATKLAGATEGGAFGIEGSVLLTRADGGFGWSVSQPWNKVRIALTGCTNPFVVTGPIDVSGESVSNRGIRLDCGTAPTSALPTITGAPIVGMTLTAVPVSLPAVFNGGALEWLRDGGVIAAGRTYVVTDADRGHELAVRQVFQHGPVQGFDGPVTFDPILRKSAAAGEVVAPLQSAPVPKISGKAAIGSKLTAISGTWTPAPVPLNYQWLRSGTAIPGAAASTYTVQKADAGAAIAVRVTAAKAGYVQVVRTSVATAKVPFLKLTAGRATVSGTAKVGKVLKANKGKWKPSGITFGYQWFVGGAPIAGATKASYHPVSMDKGKTIKVVITGSKVGYKTVTKTSKSTKKVK